ncbi:MAG: YggS family pyridoxal phosphate-dependent enzyme [Candidatus Izemoplasmatales bacterium]
MNLAKNLETVRRDLGSATLVAATKYVGADTIAELSRLGVTDVGENRTDSYLEKRAALSDLPIRWHFIGHLQSNKAKGVVETIDCLHSLDSLRLAAEIQKRRTTPLDCFVEVHVSGEPSKDGVEPENLRDFVKDLAEYDRIRVVGLMGMAAEAEDAVVLETFLRLARLRDAIRAEGWLHAPCAYLSMGMSGDYRLALQAGATHVRLGSILFRSEE